MNISNLTSCCFNPYTRSVTSNIKNTYVPEGTDLDFMFDKLRPVQSIPDGNTPFKLAGETSVDKENNALFVAKGTHLTFEGGFVYTVLESGITMGYGDDWRAERPMPGDLDNEELNSAAQSKASAFHKLLWDSSGLVNVSNYDDKAYAKWNEDVCSVLESFGIDTSKDFSINGVKYSRNEKGYFESEHSFAAKEAYEILKNNNRSYALADESTKKRVHYMSDYYLASAPEEVRIAWKETLEETGINPFQAGYGSSLQQLATEQDFATGGNDQLFGDSIESSIEAIDKILERIANPLSVENVDEENNMIDPEQEMKFYTTLRNKLVKGSTGTSFEDLMDNLDMGNSISTINQIVSAKNPEDGEIYVTYFSNESITCNNANGENVWNLELTEEQLEIVKEFFKTYQPNRSEVSEYYSDEALGIVSSKEFWTEKFDSQGFIAEFIDYEEFHKAWMSQGADTPFSYTENKGFNEKENSISLVPGMSVRLGNGYLLSITDSMVQGIGDFRDNEASKESAAIAGALNHLIKVANGQIPINMFYSRNQDNSAYAKIGLEAFGIDTTKPFTINEKTFHYDSDGQIRLG